MGKAEEMAQAAIEAIDKSGINDTTVPKQTYLDALTIVIDDLAMRVEATEEELEREDRDMEFSFGAEAMDDLSASDRDG